ncbi:MAG: hypothetical protein Q4F31_08960 [Eubacteriales bacterium]|nr:hypothetical protein [Eubacteriales bacterium]
MKKLVAYVLTLGILVCFAEVGFCDVLETQKFDDGNMHSVPQNISVENGSGIEASKGSNVIVESGFSVSGGYVGVYSADEDTMVTVIDGDVSGVFGAVADRSGRVVVNGNLSGSGEEGLGRGAVSWNEGRITVTGSVSGEYSGLYAAEGAGLINVTGDVRGTGEDSVGAEACDGGKITVNGNVEGVYSGAYAEGSGSNISVSGNVRGVGLNGAGVEAYAGAVVSVTGDVSGNNYGVYSVNTGSRIYIDGSITGTGDYGICIEEGGRVEVSGNVSGKIGIQDGTLLAEGEVTGDVGLLYPEETVFGAELCLGRIDGEILDSVGNYLRFLISTDKGNIRVSGDLIDGELSGEDTISGNSYVMTKKMVELESIDETELLIESATGKSIDFPEDLPGVTVKDHGDGTYTLSIIPKDFRGGLSLLCPVND